MPGKRIMAAAFVLALGTTCATATGPTVTAAEPLAGANEPCPPDREATLGAMSEAPPAPARPASSLHLQGQKIVARQLQRSEAGLSWALGPKLSLELDYERSALAPMMPHDHDDGFLTRLKIGF